MLVFCFVSSFGKDESVNPLEEQPIDGATTFRIFVVAFILFYIKILFDRFFHLFHSFSSTDNKCLIILYDKIPVNIYKKYPKKIMEESL